MGAYFYVEKAAFIGTFVPVYGGGDATNYVIASPGGWNWDH
jgi:hypothetical protein